MYREILGMIERVMEGVREAQAKHYKGEVQLLNTIIADQKRIIENQQKNLEAFKPGRNSNSFPPDPFLTKRDS